MIALNGRQTEIKDGITVTELLTERQFRIARVAVEHNGRILKKDEYDKTAVKDGDVIEVVSFMGGG